MKQYVHTFESFLNEGLDPKKVEKLLDELHAQSQKVKDSNYNMAEIKKLDAIEREAVKMGVAKAIGSAWHKDKTPKEVHSKYKAYGYEWMSESINEANDVSLFDDILAKNDWKEVGTRNSPGYPSGTIRYFDYENSAKKNVMIRIVDSPLNGVYVELYKDNEQITTDTQRKRNQPPKYIQTADDLIAAAKKFLNVKLN
jgi:hypothetical protein